MNQIETRIATINDLPTLLKYEQAIIAVERPFDDGLAPDPISYYNLESLITSSEAEVIVACEGNNIVGAGYVQKRKADDYYTYQYYAYFGFMYVEPICRGLGVNQLIVNNLKEWAVGKELTHCKLTVYSNNDAAIKAYIKAGFNPQIIEMTATLR